MKKSKNTRSAKCIMALVACLLGLSLAASGYSANKTPSTPLQTASSSTTRVLTDLAGRKNTVPQNITRISVIHPIPCIMVWRLAPQKLVSVDKQFDQRLAYMTPAEQDKVKSLPVTG